MNDADVEKLLNDEIAAARRKADELEAAKKRYFQSKAEILALIGGSVESSVKVAEEVTVKTSTPSLPEISETKKRNPHLSAAAMRRVKALKDDPNTPATFERLDLHKIIASEVPLGSFGGVFTALCREGFIKMIKQGKGNRHNIYSFS